MLGQAVRTLDPKTAASLTTRADTRIWQVAGSVPLIQHPQLVAVSDRVVNAGAFGFATPRFQDLGFTTLAGHPSTAP